MQGQPREISTMYFIDISVCGVRTTDCGKPMAPGQPRWRTTRPGPSWAATVPSAW